MKGKNNRNAQTGFSLIELLIVMVMMLIILGAVFSLMRGTIMTANTNYEMTNAGQGLRNAQEYINRDILTLGDGAKSISEIWLPTKFATTYLTARAASSIDFSGRGYVSMGAVVSDNNVPAGIAVAGTNPATTVFPGTDRISFLTEDKTFTSISLAVSDVDHNSGYIIVPSSRIDGFQIGEIYFLSNGVSGTFGTIMSKDKASNKIYWTNGDTYGLNRTGTTGSLYTVRGANLPMTLLRVQLIHYFVNSYNHLIRRVFGISGSGYLDSIIAEHVTNLQFRYTLTPDSDGTILEQPSDQFPLDEAVSVRMIEPFVEVETAYLLANNTKAKVDGTTQLGVRNIQFLEAPVPYDSEGNTDLPDPGPTPQITPTPTPSPTPIPTPSPTPVPTPTPKTSPTATPSPTPIPTPTPFACAKNEKPSQTGCTCYAPYSVKSNGKCK